MLTEDQKPNVENDDRPVNPRAFTAKELINCEACSRPNPPNRLNCLYCGFGLKVSADAQHHEQAVESIVEPETASYIVVASRDQNVAEDQINRAAALIAVGASELSRAFEVAHVVPIFATPMLANAEAMVDDLNSLGFRSILIAEKEMCLESPPVEVRAFEFSDESVTAIGQRGQRQSTMNWSDLTLIVAGHLHFSTVEVEQKRKRNQRKVVAERRLSTDEAVLDIYSRNENIPWRVKSNAFDFSCLRERKAATAFENYASLVALLRQRANSADFNDDYVRVRPLLEKIWPIENTEQPQQRRRVAWRELEATVTQTNNEAQFDRYSRALRRLSQQ